MGKDAVESEFSGNIQKGLLAILNIAKNRPLYFAAKLHNSMEGIGTNDKDLIRLIVSRCEIGMVEIKEEFEKTYEQSLISFIKGDTSGGYKKMLLGLRLRSFF